MNPNVSAVRVQGLSQGLTIFTFLLGIFMGALDHGIVGPALSSIFIAFGVDSSWGVWSFTIYTLVFAVSIPVLGKLSDRFGRKQTFLFGIVAFAVGSLIAAMASNFWIFLLGRAVQAIGSGGIFPITAAQIAATYPPEKRGKAMGWIGVAFGLGTILGPVAGSVIIAHFDWQWIFLINLPISAVILIMIAGYKPNQQVVNRPIDVAGIILLSAIILLIMVGISSHQALYSLIGLLLVPVLVMIEKKQVDPVLNVQYFTQGNTLTILAASLLSGFVMATATNFIPLFSETILGLEKGNAGFSVTPLAIASMVASLAGGMLVDKWGAKKVILLGFVITLAGALSLGIFVSSMVLFLPTVMIMGFGIGIIIGAPLNILILQAVDPKEIGSAVGYLSLFRSIGSTLGPAIAGFFLSSFQDGFSYIYLVSAVASVLSIVILFMFVQKKKLA
ncbi:MFS transporter [Ammoniphilus sp. CFH 90114]|uniref:MFS transporter n=1 Tax=Ammoniphilus sp. CFH 90114 TaxID=2493665 RepID=UPI00100FFD10|nr:MFS transporter [Ammoniphilus sp. CFH 90114]RXT07054.1 MFS transporter [Ammoniphilus sp. CFH 90114]